MTPMERHLAARELAAKGQHEKALQEYIWFFEHGHKEQEGLGAVRLSYILFDWMSLAELYPRAREALESIRDRKTQLLLLRLGRWDMFHEVVAINERLGCEDHTYSLFKKLAALDEQFAQRCRDVALPSILRAGDYELAERFIGDPFQEARFYSEILNRTTGKPTWADDPEYINSQIDFYAGKIRQLKAVLDARERQDEARQLHDLAVELVEADAIREAVIAALKPGARRWYEVDEGDRSVDER